MKRFSVVMGFVALGVLAREIEQPTARADCPWERLARAVELGLAHHQLSGWLNWHAAQDFVQAA